MFLLENHYCVYVSTDFGALLVCIIATFLGARIAAVFANKATAKTLNRATGIVLAVLGAAMIIVTLIQKL